LSAFAFQSDSMCVLLGCFVNFLNCSLFLRLCDSLATFKTFLVSNGNRTQAMYTHTYINAGNNLIISITSLFQMVLMREVKEKGKLNRGQEG